MIEKTITLKSDDDLFVHGHATDHIWTMADGPHPNVIGVRFDCGDSGTLYLTRQQAHSLIDDLNSMLGELLKRDGTAL